MKELLAFRDYQKPYADNLGDQYDNKHFYVLLIHLVRHFQYPIFANVIFLRWWQQRKYQKIILFIVCGIHTQRCY